MSEPHAAIGDRLREIRKRRGLSQRELAAASGVSLSWIRQLEQGEQQDTRMETARKLAVALSVPTSALVFPVAGENPVSMDAGWEPVHRALAGGSTGDVEAPSLDDAVQAMRRFSAVLRAQRYTEARDTLPDLLHGTRALGNWVGWRMCGRCWRPDCGSKAGMPTRRDRHGGGASGVSAVQSPPGRDAWGCTKGVGLQQPSARKRTVGSCCALHGSVKSSGREGKHLP